MNPERLAELARVVFNLIKSTMENENPKTIIAAMNAAIDSQFSILGDKLDAYGSLLTVVFATRNDWAGSVAKLNNQLVSVGKPELIVFCYDTKWTELYWPGSQIKLRRVMKSQSKRYSTLRMELAPDKKGKFLDLSKQWGEEFSDLSVDDGRVE